MHTCIYAMHGRGPAAIIWPIEETLNIKNNIPELLKSSTSKEIRKRRRQN